MNVQSQEETSITISSLEKDIENCISSLEKMDASELIEKKLLETFSAAPDCAISQPKNFYSQVNCYLYKYILKHYKYGANRICMWRFIKNFSPDQLCQLENAGPELRLMDRLVRIYFYSDPLDDLTCIFTGLHYISQHLAM